MIPGSASCSSYTIGLGNIFIMKSYSEGTRKKIKNVKKSHGGQI